MYVPLIQRLLCFSIQIWELVIIKKRLVGLLVGMDCMDSDGGTNTETS